MTQEINNYKIKLSVWEKAQEWERQWHGNCQNTYGEEWKQLLYANRMGLRTFHDGKSPFNFDMEGKSVLDIGGGPVSLLLKCVNVRGKVIDPCQYPKWVKDRYVVAGIEYEIKRGEELKEAGWDEVWIYNVLQHADNPEKIVQVAKKAGKLIRIFEWLETEANAGHPHILTEEKLNEWFGGEGRVETINQPGVVGKVYYGIFKGDNYA